MDRSRQIIRTSLVGIAANLALVLMKAAVGLFTHSIAVLLDAVNNLSDALSSLITIVGTRLAGKRPDRKHPYGHGRIEYLASVLIAVLVLLAGAVSMKESIEKILHPETASYNVLSLVLIGAAVAVKLAIGTYFRHVGRQVNSGALRASGVDAFFDAVLSFSTLAAGVVCMVWGVGLEGYLGVLISLAILRAGMEILSESLSAIIGKRADPALTQKLRERIASFPDVRGVYDLTLHNYGPTQIIGSVHVELSGDMQARRIHALTREIAWAVYNEFGIELTVGIYASSDHTPLAAEVRSALDRLLAQQPGVRQMHGFFCDEAAGLVMFDLMIGFEADGAQIRQKLNDALKAAYPALTFDIVLDTDLSD